MHSSNMETYPGGALLFVRSEGDLPPALRAVNDLLARRPTRAHDGERVVAIVVGGALDSPLHEPAPDRDEEELTLRDAVGLSGIWSLCSFECRDRAARADAHVQRQKLLERLSASADRARATRGDAAPRPVLVPVLAPTEVLADAGAKLASMEARHPTFAMSHERFVHDPARGGVVPLARP